MADYVVNTAQLNSCATQVAALQRKLDAVALKLGAMQLGSIVRIKASTALMGKVADCKWAAVNQSNNFGNLANGLEDIAQLYERYETNLVTPKTQGVPDPGLLEHIMDKLGNLDDIITEDWSWNELLKWLARKCVPISAILSGIGLIDGISDGDGKTIVNGLKNLLYTIGNGTKAIFGSGSGSEALLKLFGLNAQNVDDLSSSWQKFLESMRVGDDVSAAGNTAAICKWGGYILSFVAEGFDNAAEFQNDGGLSNGRFWGETLIEGATSVGLSIGASVLVAAALPASAPAILVGAVSAGAVWLGNEVCEHFTGQDIGEWVSDLVYGDGKVAEVREWVGDTVDDIAEGIDDAADAVCDWFGSLFG